METPILKLLKEYAFKLQEISPKPISDITLVLSEEEYFLLETEINYRTYNSFIKNIESTRFNIYTIGGINFHIVREGRNEEINKLLRDLKADITKITFDKKFK